MKILLLVTIILSLSIQIGFSQTLRDFKKKTEANSKERTTMLDLLRADIKNDLEQDVVFVVNHFKTFGNYAWMEGTVQRKDGKEIVFDEDGYDCCSVEALFKKVNGSWILKENGAFSTDVWFVCILSTYPQISRQIFSENFLRIQEDCGN